MSDKKVLEQKIKDEASFTVKSIVDGVMSDPALKTACEVLKMTTGTDFSILIHSVIYLTLKAYIAEVHKEEAKK